MVPANWARRMVLIGLAALVWIGVAAASAEEPPGPGAETNQAPPADADPFLDAELDTLYGEAEAGAVQVPDPIEGFNRAMFAFNDKLYFWVLKPLASGYRVVMPVEIRTCAKNFFYNLQAPVRIVNSLLQGKFAGAGSELGRFFVNSTAGILGLGSPADSVPLLRSQEEDFGQTLAVYGIGEGFYIVWPFIGSSTLRDTIGWGGDQFLTPYAAWVDDFETTLAITGFRIVNDVSFRIGDYEDLKAASLDPYAALRDGYIQFRKRKISE
jgi:phospholipid-binding lipoprotein MlaA